MSSDILGYKVYSTNSKQSGYILIGTTDTQANVSVEWIQHTLNMLYPNNKIVEDGIYGEETVNLIRRFQQDNGLTPDGQFGEKSYKSLISNSELFSSQNTSLIVKEQIISPSSLLNKTQSNISVSEVRGKMWNALKNSSSFAQMWNDSYNYLMGKHEYFNTKIPQPCDPRKISNNYKKLVAEINSSINAVRKFGIEASDIVIDNFTDAEKKHFKATLTSKLRIQMDLIAKNPVICTIQKFKNIVSPITKLLEKIPYIGQIVTGILAFGPAVISLLKGDFEDFRNKAIQGIVSLIEGGIIAAAIVFGGWIALIVFLALLVIDYFFFSDHPGETLVDRYTTLETRNIIVDFFAMDTKYQQEILMASIANLSPIFFLWYIVSRNKQYSKALSEWIK